MLTKMIDRFVLISFILSFCTVASADNFELADKAYKQGVSAFKKENHRGAIIHFEDSYSKVKHPLTAYCLSCLHTIIGNPWRARHYANESLQNGLKRLSDPVLRDRYTNSAYKIIDWADKEIKEWEKKAKKKAKQYPNESEYLVGGKAQGDSSQKELTPVFPVPDTFFTSKQSVFKVNLG